MPLLSGNAHEEDYFDDFGHRNRDFADGGFMLQKVAPATARTSAKIDASADFQRDEGRGQRSAVAARAAWRSGRSAAA